MSEEKKELKISKIKIERGLCIGAATCVVLAPETFRLDDENIAILLDKEGNVPEEILMAAESCPTKAVFIYDKEGTQIYP